MEPGWEELKTDIGNMLDDIVSEVNDIEDACNNFAIAIDKINGEQTEASHAARAIVRRFDSKFSAIGQRLARIEKKLGL